MASSSRGGGRVEHDFIHRVARELAAIRRERGISQENLAATLGMAVKNLQRIESGQQNLSLSTIARICRALGVPPDSLFGDRSVALAAESKSDGGQREPGVSARAPSLLERLETAGFVVRPGTARGRRPLGAVPVTTLRAAAGHLTGAARAVEILGFVTVPRRGKPPEGQFVAEVRGRSMAPRIPAGSICLFEPPRPPPYAGRIFLIAHPSIEDDALGGPYALKRIGAATKLRSGNTQLRLESVNPDFAPISVVVRDDEVPIIAELERVLVHGASEE